MAGVKTADRMISLAASGPPEGMRNDDRWKAESEMFRFGQSETIVKVVSEAEQVLNGRMDRRRVLRMAASIGAAVVAGGVLKAMPAGAAGSTYMRTTANLNLRASASTSAKILLLMPKGALVKPLDARKNGFLKVDYKGTVGWAYEEYLESTNPDANVHFIGTAKTTANVNLRQGPSTDQKILRVVPKGTIVEISDKAFDGFRLVRVDGQVGWIYEAYLA
jgi:uncharacterized protein YraI